MDENQKPFHKDFVAELANGDVIVPESDAELEFLQGVADNDNLTDTQKERVAKMGTLFEPAKFDVNFDTNRHKQHPTNLDPQLRQLIQEV